MKTRNRLYDKSRLRLLCLLTALLGLFGAGQTWAQTKPSSGDGTKGDPYQISTADELRWFAGLVNGTLTDGTAKNTAASATLTTNIDLGGAAWTPIGNFSANISNIYTGTFDGAGYTISNLKVDNSSADYQGFVGYLGSGGAIQNLTLDESCSVTGSDNVGGICGENYGTIKNCYNSASVSGSRMYVGGVCGSSTSGTITNCGNGGAVTSSSDYVGGVCGYSYKNSTIKNCYNTGTVSGRSYVGGICGLNRSTIESCYNTGSVSGRRNVGGVCGINYKNSTITKCYWLNTAYTGNGIGTDESGTSENVVAKTAEQFASGEVCWLLNGSASENVSWYQNLNNGQTVDEYPVPDSSHGTVYHATIQGKEIYSNSPISHVHQYDADGICTVCDGYQLAGLNGDVYEISNAGQLFWFAGLVNGDHTHAEFDSQNVAASAVLLNNITIPADMAWTPIGNASTIYTGTFDGQGYTISGMKIESTADYQGFVGYLGAGTIKNLILGEGCSVTGGKNTGGICGWNNEGTISGCTNKGAVTGGGDSGGICGHNLGPVENCENTGTITSSTNTLGGICGYSKTAITSCTNSGTIDGGSYHYVGGICGYTDAGAVTGCANSGAVTGGSYIGGVCGFSDKAITNSWNCGSVTGSTDVGGICGRNHEENGVIADNYNRGTVRGNTNVGSICGNNLNTAQEAVNNCYWLENTASTGIGSGIVTDVEAKTADQFMSGEVCWLLQNGQDAQAWGQLLGRDDFPVLTTDEAMRVYAAKLYKGSADKVIELYANTPNFSSPEEANALLVIEDAATAPAGTNVVVKSGDAYTCANLVLTDGTDFYTPVAFTAAQATYSRPLAEGTQWGTVALPFDATSVTGAELFRVASQDDGALYVDETGGMADGEPLVFRANAEVAKVVFNGTDVAVRATTDAATGSTVLKGTSQTVSQLDAGSYFIYGDKFYRVASGSQVGMKPFRAYIPAAAGASTRSAGAASQLRIVFNASETTRTAHEGK